MNPLTAALGLSMLNEKEDAVLAELRGHDLSPGLYFFPGMDMSKSMTKEQEAAWTAKFKAGPSGLSAPSTQRRRPHGSAAVVA